MRKPVNTRLGEVAAPLEWAVTADGVLYTAQVPMRPDGSIESGDIDAQTRVTMDNIKDAVESAGGTMADVTQCLIYLTDAADAAKVNEVYASYFDSPYPNRATVVVAALLVPARIEIVAYAHVG